MIEGAFELVIDDLRLTFWRFTEIPVSPHSMLCLRLRELDFLRDFDLPELPLRSGQFSFEMLLIPLLWEFLVGSLLLLHHHFFEDPLL